MIDPFDDSRLKLGDAVEYAAAYLLARDLGEKALNEIEPVRRCWDEVQPEARMALEPALYGKRLVRGVVVGDQVEIEMRDEGASSRSIFLRNFENFLGTMARQAFADNLAGRHIEGGEQGCRAMALVIMRHGTGARQFGSDRAIPDMVRAKRLIILRRAERFLRIRYAVAERPWYEQEAGVRELTRLEHLRAFEE